MLDKTVDFDDENSWEDFNIVFETMTIGSAEPQLVLIDVPFRNGSLDETDYFGDVRYKDRTITMGFLIPWWLDDQHGIFSEVQNRLNGQRKRIVFSADQDWYYEGRLKVGDFKIDNGFFKFDITATVDPYKYSDSNARVTASLEGTPFTLSNDYMKTIPTFTNRKTIKITQILRETDPDTGEYLTNEHIFSPGTHKNAAIVLEEGKNNFIATDMGYSWQEELLARPYYEETIPEIQTELIERPYYEEIAPTPQPEPEPDQEEITT